MRYWINGFYWRGFFTPGYWIEPAPSVIPDTPSPTPPPPVADVVRFGDMNVLAAKLATAFRFASDTINDERTDTTVSSKTTTVKSSQTQIIRSKT